MTAREMKEMTTRKMNWKESTTMIYVYKQRKKKIETTTRGITNSSFMYVHTYTHTRTHTQRQQPQKFDSVCVCARDGNDKRLTESMYANMQNREIERERER